MEDLKYEMCCGGKDERGSAKKARLDARPEKKMAVKNSTSKHNKQSKRTREKISDIIYNASTRGVVHLVRNLLRSVRRPIICIHPGEVKDFLQEGRASPS